MPLPGRMHGISDSRISGNRGLMVVGSPRVRDDEASRRRALEVLEAWLERNAETWAAVGGWRTMGWNSPMVRSSRRFWEVQIPIRRVAADPTTTSSRGRAL